MLVILLDAVRFVAGSVTTVSDESAARSSAFRGTTSWGHRDAGLDSHDRLLDPAHLEHIATGRE